MQLHSFASSGERSEQLVADLVIALVERMLGEVIGWNFDSRRSVSLEELARGLARIMWGVESHIHKKWFALLRRFPQVRDGVIGPDRCGVPDFIMLGIRPLFRMV